MNITENPTLLVVAGPNGSGKTTLTNRLRAMGLDFGEYINADEIALSLPGGADRDQIAQQRSNARRESCLKNLQSFSFETVMSHPSKIGELHAARQLGYHITFIGVALQSPLLNVQRVALRVSEGGHDVPEDRIIARYARTLRLMPEAIAIADRSLIFDNSDSAAGPHVCLRAHSSILGERSSVVARVSPSIASISEHWVMNSIVNGLTALQQSGAITLDLALSER